MTDRDRFKKLFNQALAKLESLRNAYLEEKIDHIDNFSDVIVDYLITGGAILPPCKVGDTVYSLMECTCEDIDGVHTPCEYYTEIAEKMCSHPKGDCPYEYRIAECIVTDMNLLHFTKKWGKTVFLTREEAEKALKRFDKEL